MVRLLACQHMPVTEQIRSETQNPTQVESSSNKNTNNVLPFNIVFYMFSNKFVDQCPDEHTVDMCTHKQTLCSITMYL